MPEAIVLNQVPFEIIEKISSYITTTDLAHVSQVSKTWHRLFHTFIYRTVQIISFQQQQTILKAFQQLPGHYVRFLQLDNILLQEQEINTVTELFPEIDTLKLDWSIWGSQKETLSPAIQQFFQHYGSHSLRHLTVNASQESIDIWSTLSLCPRLKSLTLTNLNHEHVITLGYLETIHRLLPYLTSLTIKCTRSDPDPALLPQFTDSMAPIILQPTLLESFSLSSKQGSIKWPLWLPYFSVKYPYLKHLFFKHSGLGKDSGCCHVPEQVYTLFTHGCQHLQSIKWSKIIVHHDQLSHRNLRRIEAYENFMVLGSLVNSPIVQDTVMSSLLTSLTLGQPPKHTSADQVIKAVGQACRHLKQLKVQECFVNKDLAYDLNTILNYCKGLQVLYFKDVHVKSSRVTSIKHPLQKLLMKRSSFTHNVFPQLSRACQGLDHVELLACFQTDRRDQVMIDLPVQHLTTLKIQGLRTRSYYAGCRIRFFSVNTQWYYMTHFDIRDHSVGRKHAYAKFRRMEFARQFDTLDTRDIATLSNLVTEQELKAWDLNSVNKVPHTELDVEHWDPENIYYSGLVKINAASIHHLEINNKTL